MPGALRRGRRHPPEPGHPRHGTDVPWARGHEAAAREIGQAFSRTEWDVEAWFDEGDWLLARVTIVGTGRVSGLAAPITVAHAWKLRDGKITHFYVYPSMSEAVRALQAQASG